MLRKLPTNDEGYLWDRHSFDLYPDGSFVELDSIGYHLRRYVITKGNYKTEMKEEIFFVGDSFQLRPVQIHYITRL